MKKVLLFFILTSLQEIILVNHLYSQDAKWVFGIQGAPNASICYGVPSFKKDFDIKYQLKPGFLAGAFVQYFLKSKSSICAEVNFERKGNAVIRKMTNETGEHIGEIRMVTRIDYLTVPLTYRYIFGKKKVKYFIQAGPYFGYLFEVRDHIPAYANYRESTFKESLDYYQLFDYGAVTGLGTSIPLSTRLLFSLEIRNNLGLHRLAKGESYNNEFAKNESFALLFGLKFHKATE